MKGQIYFNWIFVIVIGAIMLTFFVGFAIKYKDMQEKKTEVIMLNNLDTAFTNLKSSSFTTSTNINLPLDIGVNCDTNRGYNIFINEKNWIDHLLASKSKLKNNMQVWYQPYEIPFKVTNFYYLIDDSTVKINSIFYDEIIEEIPESFRDKVVSDPNGISIIFLNNNINEGTIDGESYLGKEMLYAGIFSDDYVCFSNNVKNKIEKSILVYQNKAKILSRSGCNYGLILSQLNNLQSNLNYQTVERITQLNRDLASRNCPALF